MPLANAHAELRKRFVELWNPAQIGNGNYVARPTDPAILARYPALVDDAVGVAYPNFRFTPESKKPFVEFRIIDEGTVQASLGVRPLYRTTGEVRMRINTPGGTGDGLALDLSDFALRTYQDNPPVNSRPWRPLPFKVTAAGVELRPNDPPYESSTGTLIQIRMNAAYRETQDPDTSYLIADVLVPYQIDIM